MQLAHEQRRQNQREVIREQVEAHRQQNENRAAPEPQQEAVGRLQDGADIALLRFLPKGT